MFAWVLALRYLRARWVNLLGTVGVMMAVWALVVVRGVFSGFIADIRTEVRRSTPDLLLTGLPHDTGFERLRAALAPDPEVAGLAPRLRHYGVFYRRTGGRIALSSELEFSSVGNNFVQLLGIDPEAEPKVTQYRDWLERGRRPRAHDFGDHGAPALGPRLQVPAEIEYFARRRAGLGVPSRVGEFRSLWPGLLLGRDRVRHQNLAIGDPLDVVSVDYGGVGGTAHKVLPLQTTFAFAGTFLTGARLFDDTTAIAPIETLRTMLGHDELDVASIDLVTDIAIAAQPGLDGSGLRALAARLLPRALAVLPQPLPPEAKPEVLTWEQQNAVFLDAVDTERAMMTVVLFVVMLIAAFLIYATLHMMVAQKVKDIGIVTALGGSPRGVGQVFTRCGAVIGAIGTSAGVLAGVTTLWNLNAMNDWLLEHFDVALFPPTLFDLQSVPYRIDTEWVVGVALAALLLTLLVAWLPARKAARMHPVEALSYE